MNDHPTPCFASGVDPEGNPWCVMGSEHDGPCSQSVPASDAATALDDAIQVVRLALAEVDKHLLHISEVEFEDAAAMLIQTRKALETTRVIDAGLVRHMAGLRFGFHEVEGVGAFKISRTADRKGWDSQALTAAVVDANLEQAQGEIPDPFTVARWIEAAAGISYWRTTVLKTLGIDAGEFCTVTRGNLTVQVVNSADTGQ